jgi:uncharacterized repeat protein (TIGR01451 family)
MMKLKMNQNILKSLVLGVLGSLAIACLFLIKPVQSLMQGVDGIQVPNAVTITGGVYTDTTCVGTPIATNASPIAPSSSMAFCYFLRNSGSYTFPNGYNVSDTDGSFTPPGGPFTVSVPFTYSDLSIAGTINETRVVTFSGNIPSSGGVTPYVVTGTVTAYVMYPSVILSKTVGLSGSCSVTNTLSVSVGSAPIAVYCYRITNNGNVPITITDLSDDKIVSIAARTNLVFPSVLPRNTTLTGALVYEALTSTITNTAKVTATHAVAGAFLSSPLSATSGASVVFVPPAPAIKLNVYLTTGSDCAMASSDTLSVVPNSSVKICYVAKNIGNTTLYTHSLKVNGATLFAGSLITLPVGNTTIFSQGPISVSGAIASEIIYDATWTGTEIFGASGDGSESATLRFADATPTPTPRPGLATPTPTPTATPSTPTDIVASISGPTNGSPNTIFSYTIRILNNSVTTAGGLVFTNTLPSNASFQGVIRGTGITCPMMPSVGDIGGTIVCNITGTLVSGQFDELSVTMRPIDSTNINTSVNASTTTYEPNRTNNVATFMLRLEPLKFFIPFVPSLLKN